MITSSLQKLDLLINLFSISDSFSVDNQIPLKSDSKCVIHHKNDAYEIPHVVDFISYQPSNHLTLSNVSIRHANFFKLWQKYIGCSNDTYSKFIQMRAQISHVYQRCVSSMFKYS